MTATQAITCPSCGGTLDVKGDEQSARTDDAAAVGAIAWVDGVPIVGALLAPLLVSATTVILTVVIVGAVMCMVCGIFALTFLRLPRF
ncbi:MAG: hypothetical protein E6J26_10510 [Chloroflexi bacterium]|nr:MAG: hypothetical protein E6J26_10510 [Chloroflexota bacterium]